MQHQYDTQSGMHLLALEKGEPVNETIERFCEEQGIASAEVSAVGAIKDPVLGYYDLDAREYLWKTFAGNFELSLLGNVSLKDGKHFLHAHPTISGRDLIAHMGHLKSGEVAVIMEVFIRPVEMPIERVFCKAISLPAWSF